MSPKHPQLSSKSGTAHSRDEQNVILELYYRLRGLKTLNANISKTSKGTEVRFSAFEREWSVELHDFTPKISHLGHYLAQKTGLQLGYYFSDMYLTTLSVSTILISAYVVWAILGIFTSCLMQRLPCSSELENGLNGVSVLSGSRSRSNNVKDSMSSEIRLVLMNRKYIAFSGDF